jgi:hypothetical protein
MGGVLYAASAIALDVGDVRSLGWGMLRRRRLGLPALAE